MGAEMGWTEVMVGRRVRRGQRLGRVDGSKKGWLGVRTGGGQASGNRQRSAGCSLNERSGQVRLGQNRRETRGFMNSAAPEASMWHCSSVH